jgi:aryl-alcohol dehydrogenase-like predicted oxidoreductase
LPGVRRTTTNPSLPFTSALDLGVNWIDTAAIYGLGHSEEMVGRALKTTSHKPYVFTKCSMRWHEDRSIYQSLKAASLQEELDRSLRRLGRDTIDLYQIHWPKPDAEIEEGWEALARFQKQGKIRWIGVSNFSVDQMKRAQKIAPITSLQPPYSMLRRAIEQEILPFAQANNIGVDQLFAHALRPADRQDDGGARCATARR